MKLMIIFLSNSKYLIFVAILGVFFSCTNSPKDKEESDNIVIKPSDSTVLNVQTTPFTWAFFSYTQDENQDVVYHYFDKFKDCLFTFHGNEIDTFSLGNYADSVYNPTIGQVIDGSLIVSNWIKNGTEFFSFNLAKGSLEYRALGTLNSKAIKERRGYSTYLRTDLNKLAFENDIIPVKLRDVKANLYMSMFYDISSKSTIPLEKQRFKNMNTGSPISFWDNDYIYLGLAKSPIFYKYNINGDFIEKIEFSIPFEAHYDTTVFDLMSSDYFRCIKYLDSKEKYLVRFVQVPPEDPYSYKVFHLVYSKSYEYEGMFRIRNNEKYVGRIVKGKKDFSLVHKDNLSGIRIDHFDLPELL